MPKKEGGLGLRNIEIWNKAAKLKYLWSICTDSASSLWVSWERSYLLKGRSIWELKCPGDCSWNWRKILALREIGRDRLKFIIGNGRRASLWFDNWHPLGPLQKILGERIIHESRFSRLAKAKSNLSWVQRSWSDTLSWMEQFRGRSLRSIVIRLMFAASIYAIWLEDDARAHGVTPKHEFVVIRDIIFSVCTRVDLCRGLVPSSENRWLQRLWGFSANIFYCRDYVISSNLGYCFWC
ncbi:unnamed protein product [Fraxinus pennsylvanica]|uniref:Reverse transcriptase zinc-binding domain-containing protein n=1 Tax=Fraxinus pennsylvanica TaxID=56036 RepID=A0AAD2A0Y8_9LAMI|nr:unnamed protein product [Fraxinus pennsylvanica]